MDETRAFRKLLTKLTPSTAKNEAGVKFVNEYTGDLTMLLKTLMDEFGRSSLNGRIKLLNFLEHCAGIVGKCEGSEEWKALLAQNLQKFVDAAVPIHFAPPSLVNIEPSRRFVRGFLSVKLIDEATCNRIVSQIDSKKHTIESLSTSRQGKYSHQVSPEEILRRMEDDRERAKKYKERDVSVVIGSREEFERMWDSTEPLRGNDLVTMKEANGMAGM